MSSWTCDGRPKNPQYAGAGSVHSAHENNTPDCEICGLPKEAMTDKVTNNSVPFNLKIAGAIALLAITVGGIFIISLLKGDRHLKTYQQAIANGDRALAIVSNHSSHTELEQAQNHLSLAITQLNQIPVDAPVYTDANQKIHNYDNLSLKISNKLSNFDLCGIEPKPERCIF